MVIPKHIVLFPDGNRRWAKENHQSIQEGYLKGKDKFKDFLRWCKSRGVEAITVFGFSSENWKRPKEQVDVLMHLLEKYLDEGLADFMREDVKVKVIGQRDKLPASLLMVVKNVEEETKHNQGGHLNLAVSYGGKWDILNAAQTMMKEQVPADSVDEATFETYLSTAGQPEPDLIIRAGGEMRLSNFLLWQAAYAELYFSPKLWPDFSEEDLERALQEFDHRQRRFGA